VVPVSWYVMLGTAIFMIGAAGVLTRRNAIVILMSIELMLNGINIMMVAFSYYIGNLTGQAFTIFIITIAAGEAAVGLAIIIAIYRGKSTLNVDEVNLLKW